MFFFPPQSTPAKSPVSWPILGWPAPSAPSAAGDASLDEPLGLEKQTTFEGSDVVLRGRHKGFCTLPKGILHLAGWLKSGQQFFLKRWTNTAGVEFPHPRALAVRESRATYPLQRQGSNLSWMGTKQEIFNHSLPTWKGVCSFSCLDALTWSFCSWCRAHSPSSQSLLRIVLL